MRLAEVLKSRIREESKRKDAEKKPSLLDVLRDRNRDLEVREHRRALLKRIGKK
jgi:hypothetical protein